MNAADSRKRKLQQIEDEAKAEAAKAQADLQLSIKLTNERDAKLKVHREITAKILPFSQTISISVGTGVKKQDFILPKDLLVLHSGYFADYYATAGEDKKAPGFATMNPNYFFHFASWLVNGQWVALTGDLYPYSIHLWEVGHFLRAPAFQNICIDVLRVHYKAHNLGAPAIYSYQHVYKNIAEGSKIRTLMAHAAARLGPLQRFALGTEHHNTWKALLREQPNLAIDMATMAGKDWRNTYPGDDEYRSLYVEDEIPLEDKWEKQILAFRTLDVIKRKAEEGCVWSMIELDHLERKKPQVNGAA